MKEWQAEPASCLTHHVKHTHTHTHRVCFHTLFACPCWLKIKNLIILVKSPGAWADSLWRAIMCIWTHTHTHEETHVHTTDPPRAVRSHTCAQLLIQVLSNRHALTSALHRMLWNQHCCWNLVKVAGSPLSHPHTHTSPGTYALVLVRRAEAQLSPCPLLLVRGACRRSDCRL